jgi:hypothetical protein
MNILFLGDSYSSSSNDLNDRHEGWPAKVTEILNAKAVNFSQAGSSLNYTFTKLDSAFKDQFYDVVIITVTSGDRIFHSDKMISSGFPRYNTGKLITGKEREAIDLFYTWVWDSRNSEINAQIFQLAMTAFSLLHPKTKFIFLPAFNSWTTSDVGNYVYTNPKLIHFSLLDPDSQKLEILGLESNRLNHLTKQQNKDLANQIVAIINQYNFNTVTPVKLDLEDL